MYLWDITLREMSQHPVILAATSFKINIASIRLTIKCYFTLKQLPYLWIKFKLKVNLIKSKVGQELIYVKPLTPEWTLIITQRVYRMATVALKWSDLKGSFSIHCFFQYSRKMRELLRQVATITVEQQTRTFTFKSATWNLQSTPLEQEE